MKQMTLHWHGRGITQIETGEVYGFGFTEEQYWEIVAPVVNRVDQTVRRRAKQLLGRLEIFVLTPENLQELEQNVLEPSGPAADHIEEKDRDPEYGDSAGISSLQRRKHRIMRVAIFINKDYLGDVEKARSLLAHEIGHIIQDDLFRKQEIRRSFRYAFGWKPNGTTLRLRSFLQRLIDVGTNEFKFPELKGNRQCYNESEDFAETFKYMLGFPEEDTEAFYVLIDAEREAWMQNNVFRRGVLTTHE